MASQTLLDQSVESTYQGVLHANGEALPTSGVATIYDGSGQASAFQLGLSSNGAAVAGGFSCSGQLTAGNIRYTTTDSISGANFPLVSDGDNTAVFGQMTSDALLDLTPSPAGEYDNVQYIAVNSKGLVTNVVGGSNTATAWATFTGKDVAFTFTVIDSITIQCVPSVATALLAGNVITIKNAVKNTNPGTQSVTNLNSSFVVQSANLSGTQFTFANPDAVGLPAGTTGSGTIDVTLKTSYNVSRVTRVSSGIFDVYFSTAFKNRDYVTVCGAKSYYSPTNLQTNVVDTQKEYARIRSFYANGTSTTLSDDGYTSLYCIGSNVEDTSSVRGPLFDNYTYTNYYMDPSQPAGSNGAGSDYIPSAGALQTIDPAYMAANKYNAVIVGGYGYINRTLGTSTVWNQGSLSTGSGTKNIALQWNGFHTPEQYSYIYNVIYYTNNTLYYGLFCYTNSSWYVNSALSSGYAYVNKSAAGSIFAGLAAQGIASTVRRTGTGSRPGTWLSNFINNYGSALQAVNSVSINMTTTTSIRNEPATGTLFAYNNRATYYTPSP